MKYCVELNIFINFRQLFFCFKGNHELGKQAMKDEGLHLQCSTDDLVYVTELLLILWNC